MPSHLDPHHNSKQSATRMATPEANAAEEIINDRGGEDGKPPLPGSSPKSMPQQPQTPLQRHQDPPPVAGAKQQQEWTAAPSGDRTLEPAIVTRLRTTAVDDYRCVRCLLLACLWRACLVACVRAPASL